VAKVKPLYRALLAEENRVPNRKDGMQRGYEMLVATLKDARLEYDEFVFSL
jgi:hypothetical protein